MRIRYTMLAVTVNTNKAPNTAMQEQFYIDGLRRFVEVTLNSVASWQRVLTVQPNFDAIDYINVDAIGVERGSERHRMHVHFVVTIQHHGKVMLTKNTNWLWKKLADESMRFADRGCNVQVDLLNSSYLNYVTKHSGGLRQLSSIGVQPAEAF